MKPEPERSALGEKVTFPYSYTDFYAGYQLHHRKGRKIRLMVVCIKHISQVYADIGWERQSLQHLISQATQTVAEHD